MQKWEYSWLYYEPEIIGESDWTDGHLWKRVFKHIGKDGIIKRYELPIDSDVGYIVSPKESIEVINTLGAEGWEFVPIQEFDYRLGEMRKHLLRRPVEE
jgi:hypothetical protein